MNEEWDTANGCSCSGIFLNEEHSSHCATRDDEDWPRYRSRHLTEAQKLKDKSWDWGLYLKYGYHWEARNAKD